MTQKKAKSTGQFFGSDRREIDTVGAINLLGNALNLAR
jgi:hypothetical protein